MHQTNLDWIEAKSYQVFLHARRTHLSSPPLPFPSPQTPTHTYNTLRKFTKLKHIMFHQLYRD